MSYETCYRQHLDRVSRSFAFCIARLDGDLRDWVALSYLLCRILDTVEDASWASQEDQNQAFLGFESFIKAPPSDFELSIWFQRFPALPEGEKALLDDSFRIFALFHSLPQQIREKIQSPVLNMYRGMRFFGDKRTNSKELRLNSVLEVNQYCFFVAGLVGELLTELVLARKSSLTSSPKLFTDAHHFGLFLQKVNLLKDQAEDEREGRFLVPSRAAVLGSLVKDAEGALAYIISLPVAERGFRLFCAWSLFLGLASLPWIERSRYLGLLKKIPRMLTEKLLASVESIIDDNHALLGLFKEMAPKLVVGDKQSIVGNSVWPQNVYCNGSLDERSLRELGVLV